jgi:hypothetical protein
VPAFRLGVQRPRALSELAPETAKLIEMWRSTVKDERFQSSTASCRRTRTAPTLNISAKERETNDAASDVIPVLPHGSMQCGTTVLADFAADVRHAGTAHLFGAWFCCTDWHTSYCDGPTH